MQIEKEKPPPPLWFACQPIGTSNQARPKLKKIQSVGCFTQTDDELASWDESSKSSDQEAEKCSDQEKNFKLSIMYKNNSSYQ